MFRGILACEDDEHFVELRSQHIQAVTTILGKFEAHRRKTRAHSPNGCRCELHGGARRFAVKVRQTMDERFVMEEFADERVHEEEADAVEEGRFPVAYLARRRKEHDPGTHGVAVPVEPAIAPPVGDDGDVEELERVGSIADERRDVVHPFDVDEQVATVLGLVECDLAHGRSVGLWSDGR